MPEALVLALLVAAGWFLGRLALSTHPFRPAKSDPGAIHFLEWHFASLSLGLMLVGWAAFALAEVGLFSLAAIGLLWLAAVLLLGLAATRRTRRADSQAAIAGSPSALPLAGSPSASFAGLRLPGRLEIVLLALWLAAALWLFFRPHETFLGGSDAGVYVNTAAHVARTGGLQIYDETLANLDPSLYPALLRERRAGEGTPYYLYPGFNVVLQPPGRILPDFFHLHPVWQAVVYAAGGLWAALLLPGLWALLGAFAVYLTLRQLAGWPVALLALAGLTVNALQVWFARYPVTEMLTQYLLWTALWALGAWLANRRPLPLWGLLAGLALGQLFLTRIDTLFLLLIPLLAAAWLTYRRAWQRVHLWFFAPLSLLTLHAFAHIYAFSGPYFARISYYLGGLLQVYWPVVLLLALTALLALALLFRARLPFARPAYRRPLLALAAVLILVLVGYGWFVRPVVGAAPSYPEWYDGQIVTLTDRENLVRLGWYLSPLGVWLGALGVCLLTWRLSPRSVPLVGVGLFFSLLYLWRIQATPHQIYAMRRYVPATLPLFIAGAAYLIDRLGRHPARGPRALALFLIPLWLAGLGWSARGFITQVDRQGLIDQVQEVETAFPDASIFIFNDQAPVGFGDLLGTPLHFIYGHDAFTLRDPGALESGLQQQIALWQEAGRAVYWVGDTEPLDRHGLHYRQETIELNFTFLESAYEHKPTRLIPAQWVLPLSRLN